jgi:succinate dehydrogenase / fumarate reductase cytochrome b subunit
MSSLQLVFLTLLTALLVAAIGFTAVTVRAALAVNERAEPSGWRDRISRATERDAQGWAFVLHRATGVAVFAFLALHILDVSLYAVSATRFDDVHSLYGTTPMRLFESLLLFGILFHAFNGLRLVALDLIDVSTAAARRMLHVAVGLSLVLGVAASAVILQPVLT